jgi:hypothetical protein
MEDGPSNDGLIQNFNYWCGQIRLQTALRRQKAEWGLRGACITDISFACEARLGQSAAIPFDPEAQLLFVEWLADVEKKIRGGELHAAVVSHLSKYRKLMPALALLFELADQAVRGFDGFVGSSPGNLQNFWVSWNTPSRPLPGANIWSLTHTVSTPA